MKSYSSIFFIIALLLINLGCTKQKQEFSFVQLCDTQLGMGGYEHDLETFKQAVQQINHLNVDFAVICGDLVNDAADSTYADFLSIMKGFEIPCYVAPGNHDVGNIPSDTSLTYYRKIIGEDYYDFKHKGFSFLVTNTQLWKVHVDQESERHDQWFNKSLEKNRDKNHPKIVIGHYPIFTESPEEEDHYYNLPLGKRKEILAAFKSNNVKAYLSGHTHKLVINNYENIQMVSGETTSKNFDERPMGFRLWEVSSDTLKHQFIQLQP